MLYVGGTTDAAGIRVTPVGKTDQIEVVMNGVSEGTFSPRGVVLRNVITIGEPKTMWEPGFTTFRHGKTWFTIFQVAAFWLTYN